MRLIKLFVICLLLLTATQTFAQTETFDIATFTPPKGWEKSEGSGGVSFIKVDQAAGKFCLIAIYPSSQTSGTIDTDFENEWQKRVSKPLTTNAKPEMKKMSPQVGWDVLIGAAVVESDGMKLVATLAVFKNPQRTISVLISLNDMSFEKDFSDFLNGLRLQGTLAGSDVNSSGSPVNSGSVKTIVGNWGDVTSGSFGVRNSSGTVSTGRGGTLRSYEFKADGTYTFVTYVDIVLNGSKIQTHETGKYTITGERLTLTPVKLIYRRNGVDETPSAGWRDPRTYKWRIEKDGAATNLVLLTGTFEDRFLWNR